MEYKYLKWVKIVLKSSFILQLVHTIGT